MLLAVEEIPQVEMEFMNKTHAEEVTILNEIFEAILNYDETQEANDKLDELYTTWLEHTIEHFKTEEVKMQEMRFPPYMAHKGEHDRALQEMRNIFSTWQQQRDIKKLKIYFIEVVPAWLENHIATMDTITARFFSTGMSPCGI